MYPLKMTRPYSGIQYKKEIVKTTLQVAILSSCECHNGKNMTCPVYKRNFCKKVRETLLKTIKTHYKRNIGHEEMIKNRAFGYCEVMNFCRFLFMMTNTYKLEREQKCVKSLSISQIEQGFLVGCKDITCKTCFDYISGRMRLRIVDFLKTLMYKYSFWSRYD